MLDKILKLLLIITIVTSSFTSLRIGPVGPAEFTGLIFMVCIVIKFRINFMFKQFNVFILFWVYFILSVFVSSLINFHFLGNFIGYGYRELLAYTFVFFLFITFIKYFESLDLHSLKRVITRIYYISSITFTFLYFISLFMNTLFGIELYFGGVRLSLLSDNPHQLALYVGSMLLLSIYYLFNERLKSVHILFTAVYLGIALNTDATTFIVAILVSGIVLITVFIYSNLFKGRHIYLFVSIVSFLFFFILILFVYTDDLIIQIFESDENGLVRLMLWNEAILNSANNLFFGYGAENVLLSSDFESTIEAHNTFLDILLKGGLMAVLLFVLAFLLLIKDSIRNPFIISILIFFIFYSMSGFILKRIVLWFFIALFIVYKKKWSELN